MIIPPAIVEGLKSFCERHLIADDTYQYDNFTVDQLIVLYFSAKSQALIREMQMRAAQENTSRDDKEILLKTLANEKSPLSDHQRAMIRASAEKLKRESGQ